MSEELIYDALSILNIIGCREVKFDERHLDIHWVDDLKYIEEEYEEED